MSTVVRRFRNADGPRLFEIFVRSVRTLGSPSYTPTQIEAWLSGMTAEGLESRLRSMTSFTAESEGLVVGFSSFDARHSELDFLYVDPDWAGQGIGRMLTVEVEIAAAAVQTGRLFIVASLNALPIYEKLGYAREKDMKKIIDGVTVPCVRMFKDLPAALRPGDI